jgi:Mn2+/Fe2+ NRAMP family transporter
VVIGADPDRRAFSPTAVLKYQHRRFKETDHMPAIIVIAAVAIVALIILGLAVHLLFSPWLLVAVAIVAFIKFRPRRSRQ